MGGLSSLLSMLCHPAPGLKFPHHDGSGVGPVVVPVSHHGEPPASDAGLKQIDALCENAPELASQLGALYGKHDGVAMSVLPALPGEDPMPAAWLLPTEDWDAATDEWTGDDMSWAFEGLEMYSAGTWRVIGGIAGEGTDIVLFFDGEHNGEPLAGKCFCISLDPVLGYEEVVARSVDSLLARLGDDLVGFLSEVEFCWTTASDEGTEYGWEPDEYLPDVRGNELLVEPH